MPPNSSLIDAALVAKLATDATLRALLPDGVFIDEGANDATRLVVVSLFDQTDTPVFGGRAIESALYMVKAVGLKYGPPVDMAGAAHRIDELLDDGTLDVAGYVFMDMFREGQRIHRTEVENTDKGLRWFHRGGYYRVRLAVA